MNWIGMLWSHCRNINVVVFKDVIKYSIPVYSETGMIGKVKSIDIQHGTIEIVFHTKIVPEDKTLLK
jgi:hypothetical protein